MTDGLKEMKLFFRWNEKKERDSTDIKILLEPVTLSIKERCALQFNDLYPGKKHISIRIHCDAKNCRHYKLELPTNEIGSDKVNAKLFCDRTWE